VRSALRALVSEEAAPYRTIALHVALFIGGAIFTRKYAEHLHPGVHNERDLSGVRVPQGGDLMRRQARAAMEKFQEAQAQVKLPDTI
jgi:hypothetical protein